MYLSQNRKKTVLLLCFLTSINISLCQYSFSLPYSFGFEKEYWLRWFNENRILDSLSSNPPFIKHYKIKSIIKQRTDYEPFSRCFISKNEYNKQGMIVMSSNFKRIYTEEGDNKIETTLYYDEKKGFTGSSNTTIYNDFGIALYISLDSTDDLNPRIQKCYYDNRKLIAVSCDDIMAEYHYLDSFTTIETIYRLRRPLEKEVYISSFNTLHQKIADVRLADNLKDTAYLFLYEYDDKNRLILVRELQQTLKNRKNEFGVHRLELEYENEKLASLAFFEWGEENYPIRYCLSYQGNLLIQVDIYSVFAKKRTYRLRYEFYE